MVPLQIADSETWRGLLLINGKQNGQEGRAMTRTIFAALLMLWSCSALASDYAEATGGESRVSVVIIDDYRAVLELFEQLYQADVLSG